MANELNNVWGSASSISTLTNLHGLTDGNVWQSAVLSSERSAGITYPGVKIWYNLDWSTTPTLGDSIEFYIAEGDEGSGTEIWDGNISEGENEIAAGAAVDRIVDNISAVHRVSMSKTTYSTDIKGSFKVYDIAPDWVLLIRILTNTVSLASSGNEITYRYFELQPQ